MADELNTLVLNLDAAALQLETDLQVPLLGSRNQLEAVQARFLNRPPKFDDPR